MVSGFREGVLVDPEFLKLGTGNIASWLLAAIHDFPWV